MILYYAAAETCPKTLAEIGVKNLLITMTHGERKIPKIPEIFNNEYNLLIDSGAFTYSKKGGISVEDWLTKALYLKQFGNDIIGLDVIGNAQKTYDNYVEIIKQIPDAIPTFHVGSDIKYLFKYLEDTDRIAIGGMVGYKSDIATLKKLLNEIFKNFSKESLPRFHAFGYFSQNILESYPFFSADATTWRNYSKFGEFHNFIGTKYTRMKSLKVGDVDLRRTELDDIYTYLKENEIQRLLKIKIALDEFEIYLTHLWQKRGIEFK